MKPVSVCLFAVIVLLAALPASTQAAERGAGKSTVYSVVLFPVKVLSPWGEGYLRRTELLAVEGLGEVIADDVLLSLKYTYLQTGENSDAGLLAEATGSRDIDVWRQVSLLSNYSPDWSRVKAVGAKIDADIAVLIRIKKDANSLVVIYLYDYGQGDVYTKTSRGVYWGSMATGVQEMAKDLIQEFYDNR